VGAAVAALAFWPMASWGLPACLFAIAVCTAVGVWASDRCEPLFGRSDDGRIVIDEVAGQWITLLPLVPLRSLPLGEVSFLPVSRIAEGDVFFALVVTGFVLFRVFDIRKPGPVRWAEERYRGGVGVMADDIVAGVLAAIVLTVPCYVVLLALL
jgi:phosphatidylglycerophosphatase A